MTAGQWKSRVSFRLTSFFENYFGQSGRIEVDHLFDFLWKTLWITWGKGGEKSIVKGFPSRSKIETSVR